MVKKAVKNWAPKKDKKIMGVPERFGFAIVVVFVVLLVVFVLLYG